MLRTEVQPRTRLAAAWAAVLISCLAAGSAFAAPARKAGAAKEAPAIAAWKRISAEMKAGAKQADIKLPEAMPTLDWMIGRLAARRGQLERAKMRDKHAVPEKLFVEALHTQALELKAKGVPYDGFLRLSTWHFPKAMDLAAPAFRAAVELADLDPALLTPSFVRYPQLALVERMMLRSPSSMMLFPTHEALGITAINKSQPYPVRYIGLSVRPQYVDGRIFRPLAFTAHDYGHAYVGGEPKDEVAVARGVELSHAFHAELGRVRSPALRGTIRRAWFVIFHEMNNATGTRPEVNHAYLDYALQVIDTGTTLRTAPVLRPFMGNQAPKVYDEAMAWLKDFAARHPDPPAAIAPETAATEIATR